MRQESQKQKEFAESTTGSHKKFHILKETLGRFSHSDAYISIERDSASGYCMTSNSWMPFHSREDIV
jgi:hypothetical protein